MRIVIMDFDDLMPAQLEPICDLGNDTASLINLVEAVLMASPAHIEPVARADDDFHLLGVGAGKPGMTIQPVPGSQTGIHIGGLVASGGGVSGTIGPPPIIGG
jgi:hypothetical protein